MVQDDLSTTVEEDITTETLLVFVTIQHAIKRRIKIKISANTRCRRQSTWGYSYQNEKWWWLSQLGVITPKTQYSVPSEKRLGRKIDVGRWNCNIGWIGKRKQMRWYYPLFLSTCVLLFICFEDYVALVCCSSYFKNTHYNNHIKSKDGKWIYRLNFWYLLC